MPAAAEFFLYEECMDSTLMPLDNVSLPQSVPFDDECDLGIHRVGDVDDKMHRLTIEDLFCATITSDIENLSKMIHYNCYEWDVHDVVTFLGFVNERLALDNNIPSLAGEIGMNGSTLCSLSEGEFRESFGKDADIIRGYLECWITVCFPETPDNCHDFDASAVVFPETEFMMMSSLSVPKETLKYDGSTEQPVKRKRGRPRKYRPEGEPKKKKKKILWKFLLEHLDGGEFKHCVRWINRSEGLFRFVSREKESIANQWGREKGHKKLMTYQKMARAMRDYKKKKVMEKCRGKLHFKFCPGVVRVYGTV